MLPQQNPCLRRYGYIAALLCFALQGWAQCPPITIDPFTVTSSAGGRITGLTVAGTQVAPKCDKLLIRVRCENAMFEKTIAGGNPTWSVDFTSAEFKSFCPCPATIAVEVECIAQGAVACTAKRDGDVKCVGTGCGSVNSIVVDPLDCKQRLPNGDWPVKIRVFTTGTVSSVFVLYGDEPSGSPFSPVPGPISNPIVLNHVYNCPRSYPDYTGSILIISGPTCQPSTKTFSVNFPECPCPNVSLQVVSVNKCTVIYKAIVDGSCNTPARFIWSFGDGATATTTTPTVSHVYPSNNNYTATVLADGVGDNCSALTKITLTECVVCKPDCRGKTCGDDGCGGNCGICPEGATCVDNNCKSSPGDGGDDNGGDDNDGGGGGGGCGWRFWECFNLCWFFALLVMLALAARLVLLGNLGWSITSGILAMPLDALLQGLILGFVILLLGFCPCEVPYGIIAGVILAIVFLAAQWIITGVMPPFFWATVMVGLGLFFGALGFLSQQCD